jgi:hypothetical protein
VTLFACPLQRKGDTLYTENERENKSQQNPAVEKYNIILYILYKKKICLVDMRKSLSPNKIL